MTKKLSFIALNALFCFYNVQLANAQETEQEPQWALQLGVQQQDLAVQIPYGELGTVHPVHLRPFYSIDVQHKLKVKGKKYSFVTGQLGYYNNTYHENWISAKLGFGRELTLSKKFFASLRLEAGIARAKNSDVQYRYESNRWVPSKNYEKASIDILVAPRLDIGYHLTNQFDLVATTQFLTQFDTSIESGIPMYGIGIGLRYHL